MFEQEIVDLTEYFHDGGQTLGVRRKQGWCLVAVVWDSRGQRLLGCLRMETVGAGDEGGFEVVTEFEEAATVLAVPAAA